MEVKTLIGPILDGVTFAVAYHFYRHPNPQRFWFGRIGLIYSLLRRITFLSDRLVARIVRRFAELGMIGFWIAWLGRFQPNILQLPARFSLKSPTTGKFPLWLSILGWPFMALETHQYRRVVDGLAKARKPMLDKYNLVYENGNERIYVGLWPGLSKKELAMPEGVEYVLDLTNEFDEPSWVLANREYINFPVWDQYVPQDKEAFIRTIEYIASNQRDGGLYVHCAFGVGRSAMATVCILLKRGHAKTIEEAYKMLKAARPMVELRPMHMEFLNDVAPRLIKSPK